MEYTAMMNAVSAYQSTLAYYGIGASVIIIHIK